MKDKDFEILLNLLPSLTTSQRMELMRKLNASKFKSVNSKGFDDLISQEELKLLLKGDESKKIY